MQKRKVLRKRTQVTEMISTILNNPHDNSYCLFKKDSLGMANDPRVDMM